jgi:hypothetical protein
MALLALMCMYVCTYLPTQDHPNNKRARGSEPVLIIHLVQREPVFFNSLAAPPEPEGLHEKERQVENSGIEPATYEGVLTK